MTFFDPDKTLIADTECYPNYWCIGFRRVSDGKTLVMEHSHRRKLDHNRLAALLKNNLVIGFNWQGYDRFMVTKAAEEDVTNSELKALNDRIIVGKLKWWEVEEACGFRVPWGWKYWDLMEVQPSVAGKDGGGEQRAPGLKLAMARMHCPTIQDLPYEPDTVLTEEQMDEVATYMCNDLYGTHRLFEELHDSLRLRHDFGKKYGLNLMSRSDSQCGEAIFKKRVKDLTGNEPRKGPSQAGSTFRFSCPSYIKFDIGTELHDIHQRILNTDFQIDDKGKVVNPDWLAERTLQIGQSTYQVGIGGLHSTEKNRCLWSDDDYVLIDFDVGSYYPNTILNAGLYPKAIGPEFLKIYGELTEERLAAKAVVSAKTAPANEMIIAITTSEGVKIFVNGGGFGKLGSPWSVMYAPHLMAAVTLTGQLALLMLIQRAEALGVSVVSANTDGVVFKAPRHMVEGIARDRVTGGAIAKLIEAWERDTGFSLEATEYRAILNQSVNDYIALKPDGKAKRKGKLSNPYKEGVRTMLSKNPQAGVSSDAVVEFLKNGTPIEDTIRACTEIRDFLKAVKVNGGAIWRGDNRYLGKVVRFIWGYDGAEIIRAKGHHKTGTQGKVSDTEGSLPMMILPEEFPAHLIDYDRYIQEAQEILMNIGFTERPDPVKPIRLYKWSAPLFWALAA